MGLLKIPGIIQTSSEKETRKVGRALSDILREEDVVSLEGELGSGKTQIVKGVAESMGLEADQTVFSPTFSIINIYDGLKRIYHVDLYRLSGDYGELEQTGFFEIVGEKGITLIEWGDRAKNYLPSNCIRIILKILDENRREIRFLEGWDSSY